MGTPIGMNLFGEIHQHSFAQMAQTRSNPYPLCGFTAIACSIYKLYSRRMSEHAREGVRSQGIDDCRNAALRARDRAPKRPAADWPKIPRTCQIRQDRQARSDSAVHFSTESRVPFLGQRAPKRDSDTATLQRCNTDPSVDGSCCARIEMHRFSRFNF
jgi:hypothetical protein